jgi:hypothetical protein
MWNQLFAARPLFFLAKSLDTAHRESLVERFDLLDPLDFRGMRGGRPSDGQILDCPHALPIANPVLASTL